jgi:hypothetical protein
MFFNASWEALCWPLSEKAILPARACPNTPAIQTDSRYMMMIFPAARLRTASTTKAKKAAEFKAGEEQDREPPDGDRRFALGAPQNDREQRPHSYRLEYDEEERHVGLALLRLRAIGFRRRRVFLHRSCHNNPRQNCYCVFLKVLRSSMYMRSSIIQTWYS